VVEILTRRLRLLCVGLALVLSLSPRLAAASQWGSSYGDPPGFCPAQSWLPRSYWSLPVTNDPTVADNPEANTFYGYHSDPGYDNWYGYWYGDFRGRPGDASGWREIVDYLQYPNTYHWNFGDWGWAVHGHAKQYIAYYNWTFGGQCGMGWYGSWWPAPYMADVDGWPVVDIYVDSVPPANPVPRVSATTTTSIGFTWDPVSDQGDGAGPDYVVVGLDHYTSWLTVDGGPPVGRQDSSAPLQLSATATPRDTVCAFVTAADKLGNTTPPQSVCGSPVGPPPLPPPPSPGSVAANPVPGLSGLPAWFWLQPAPAPVTTQETVGGRLYRVVAQPVSADWSFGDGSSLPGAGFGAAYPTPSSVQHPYDAESASGYLVAARVNYTVSYWWLGGGGWVGPYPLGAQAVVQAGLSYPVRQAQPELIAPG
jgi:hypothetical protein